MRAVLLLWCTCLLVIVLSLVHFVWMATAAERMLTLAVLVLAEVFALRGRR